MTAAELMDRCRTLGIDLAAGPDGALHWQADHDPPPDLLADLAHNKAQVLVILWNQTAGVSLARPSPPSPPSPAAGHRAADLLLKDLNTEIDRIETVEFANGPPAALRAILADALAIGADYVNKRPAEAVEMLKGLRCCVCQYTHNARKLLAAGKI